MSAKVIVLGGGVGGLSAAHELVERGYEVEVYERRPKLFGGKARSMPAPGTGTDGRQDLPGEHGFRFFPGFYKNLPDTMKRIPCGSNPNGCFDNLVATDQIEMSRENGPPIRVPAHFPETIEEWIEAIKDIVHLDTGIPLDQELFFAERLFQILTSCQDRRLAEYEKIAWWEFIKADQMCEAYQKILAQGLTRSLVAMQAQVANTRTVGDILIQLILNSVVPGEQADRVLNAPTNDAWLFPWVSYLQNKGVKLVNDAVVTKLNFDGSQITGAEVEVNGQPKTVTGDCFVSAMPVDIMQPLLKKTPEIAQAAPSLAGIDNLQTSWMNGIQFYLNVDVPIDQGHCIFLDSVWALTSISQHQFWPNVDLSDYGDGQVKGVLSIDISDWFAPGNKTTTKQAHECTADEIQREVWAQLKDSLNWDGTPVLEDSQLVGWHLDPDITFPRTPGGGDANEEPLLINTVDSWQWRPESAVEIPNLFLASDYVRTAVDLATMEGANEAARGAVNGILKHTGSSEPECEIWPLEEPLIFAPLRAIDKFRFELGLPWACASPFS